MTVEERVKARSEFKKTLLNKTEEELQTLLKDIIEESKELDAEVANIKYDLDDNGQTGSFEAIRYFLNKQEVQWNYTLGIIELYEFFNVKQKTINFATLDTVLRMLGSLKFTGYDEWKKVEQVNTYFRSAAESYKDVTDRIYDIAERYQAVEGQLKMFQPVDSDENTQAE